MNIYTCSISSYISINKLHFSRNMSMRIVVFCCSNEFQFAHIFLHPHSWVIVPSHTDFKAPFKVKINYLLHFASEHPIHFQLHAFSHITSSPWKTHIFGGNHSSLHPNTMIKVVYFLPEKMHTCT